MTHLLVSYALFKTMYQWEQAIGYGSGFIYENSLESIFLSRCKTIAINELVCLRDLCHSVKRSLMLSLTTVSSSQQAAHVQEVACGSRIPSSIKQCNVRPPNRMLLFQSLLLARPQADSNSLGVYHLSLTRMHRPLPP